MAQPALTPAQKKELFSKYVSSITIVIADSSSSSRVRLAKTLVDLGAKRPNIALANTYEEAEAEIKRLKPKMVLCDYVLTGGRSGLDLLQEQKALYPDGAGKDTIFVLVTGNTSQSAVASAAEEDVDTFILKPYTIDSIKNSLVNVTIAKLYPNDYIKMVETGKTALFAGEMDAAVERLDKAKTMDSKPTLACFYRGQVDLIREALEDAQGDFKKGLSYNKIHYKCLVGLYELLMKQKKHAEAYSVIKRLAQYFPANPKRLASVLRLAIVTENYDDIEGYYQIFTCIENRTDELVRYICSALIVCGKHYLARKVQSRALELFEKVAISCAGRTKFLRFTIETLVEFKLPKEGAKYLARFPQDQRDQEDFLSMDYLIFDQSSNAGTSIQKGRALINKDVHCALIYEILIRRHFEAKLIDAGDGLLENASKRWPNQADRFQKLKAEALEVAAAKAAAQVSPSA